MGGFWLPLLLLFLFTTVAGTTVLSLLLFTVALLALLALGAVAAGVFFAGVVQALMPRSATAARATMDDGLRPARRGGTALPEAPAAPYRLPGGALAARDGLDLYRRRLLEVLKERYVRGQISLAEFEGRAGRIARDPSARHLMGLD